MTRKNLLAANWKMNGSLETLSGYFEELRIDLKTPFEDLTQTIDLLFGIPLTLLARAGEILQGTRIHVAAQNCHWKESGAFTGEISLPMLQEIGIQSCIIGHSERRLYENESDINVGKKVAACVARGVMPIICVGESQSQRDQGLTREVIAQQLDLGLGLLDKPDELVIAYEPVWAIGTGLAASPEEANGTHQEIRDFLAKKFSSSWAEQIRVLYGGSLKPENAASFSAQDHIDGGLVGGASLIPADFAAIIHAFVPAT